MANLVMETVSDLQRTNEQSSLKNIKSRIIEKYGNKAEKYMRLVPQFLRKGMNLGIIQKYGDNYRTKMYVAARRRRKGIRKRTTRRRRKRRH